MSATSGRPRRRGVPTWQGCHGGRWAKNGFRYCADKATHEVQMKVESLDGDEVVETLGIEVCEKHYRAILFRPEAWSVQTQERFAGDATYDARPRIFATPDVAA